MDQDEKNRLLKAMRLGDEKACAKLIAVGELDPSARDKNGSTPLHEAAIEGNLAVCEVLLKNNAKVDLKDRDGKTPLAYAAGYANSKLCQLLLDAGADPNSRDHLKSTPLHEAAPRGDLALCKTLLKGKAKVDLKAADRWTALFCAVAAGRSEICAFLLESGANPNLYDFEGATPLHRAAAALNAKICETLIEHGADIAAKSKAVKKDSVQWGPLAFAYFGYKRSELKPAEKTKRLIETISVLFERGLDPNQSDGPYSTPLVFAISEGLLPLAARMIEAGANPNLPDARTGEMPLLLAAALGNRKMCDLLIANGADPFAKFDRMTPAEVAKLNGHSALAAYLLKAASASPLAAKEAERELAIREKWKAHGEAAWNEARSLEENLNSLLFQAIQAKNIRQAKSLLLDGANPDARDGRGMRPLHHAAAMADPAMCYMLRKHGADLWAVDSDGLMPSDWAASGGGVRAGCEDLPEEAYEATKFILGFAGSSPKGKQP